MGKAILINIKPEYVFKILKGIKKIEIRKTMPKCDLPIDVYIYCGKHKSFQDELSVAKLENRNKIVEEYGVLYWYGENYGNPDYDCLNGKIVAKFTLNKITNIEKEAYFRRTWLILYFGAINMKEFYEYSKHGVIYAWHIDNLKIFDKPIKLKDVKRPPRSWRYIFINENKEENKNNVD